MPSKKQAAEYRMVLKKGKQSQGGLRQDQEPISYSIKLVKQPHFYSEEQILRYLANPKNVKWIKTENLLESLTDACVDGRETETIIASPGGDIAILAEAIISIGKLVRRHLDPFEIRQVFKWRVEKMGSFYFHTDSHALENLQKGLNQDMDIKRKFNSRKQVLRFLVRPPARLQTALMSHIFKIENIGCGHLKLMLSEPHAYGMSRKVLQGIIRAYFNMLWNGTKEEKARINFRVLEGDHREGAVVTILIKGEVNEKTLVPAVRPTDGKLSMFVFHPQVSEFMHRNLAVELAKSGLFPEISKSEVRSFIKMMGRVQSEGLRETVSRLAFGLPMYTFEFKH